MAKGDSPSSVNIVKLFGAREGRGKKMSIKESGKLTEKGGMYMSLPGGKLVVVEF